MTNINELIKNQYFKQWWENEGSNMYLNEKIDELNSILDNEYKNGGGIHIKKSHEGLFTKKANRAGMSVQKFANKVLSNKDRYPASTIKQAVFAKNAKGWKHADGGFNYVEQSLVNPPINKNLGIGNNGFLYNPEISIEDINEQDNVEPTPIDYDLIRSKQGWAESLWKDNAVSPAGAIGIYQIMPATKDKYVSETGNDGDLTDPQYNKEVRDWFWNRLSNVPFINSGNPTEEVKVAKMLASYNWGTGNLLKKLTELKNNGVDIYNSLDWVDTLPKEPRDYVNFILRGQDTGAHRTNEQYNKAKSKK